MNDNDEVKLTVGAIKKMALNLNSQEDMWRLGFPQVFEEKIEFKAGQVWEYCGRARIVVQDSTGLRMVDLRGELVEYIPIPPPLAIKHYKFLANTIDEYIISRGGKI